MSEATRSINLLASLRCRPDAQAVVRGSESAPSVAGLVRFFQTKRGVLVLAEISGLPEAEDACGKRFFAFHIHSGASCSGNDEDSFANALTHYNPGGCPHPAHAGDLPPLLANRGCALQLFLTDSFTVREIIGRTIIIHSGWDDFSTQPGSNAGSKIACGQIRAAGSR